MGRYNWGIFIFIELIKKSACKKNMFELVWISNQSLGSVAQLVRAHACHAWGREFEPRRSRHLNLEPL